MQRFVDDELGRAPALVERTVAGTLQLLRDTRDSPLSAAERTQRVQLVEALERQHAIYCDTFVQALRAGVFEVLAEMYEGLPSQGLGTDALELLDESHIEVDIAISRAMQLIDTTAEWQLRELQTFTSTLAGQSHVSAESNPFRPLVYATALWRAACAISPQAAQRTALLQISAGVTAGLLKSAWAAACTRLETQGVEPSVYRTVVLVAANMVGRETVGDPGKAQAMSHLLASMPAGSESVKVGVGNAAVPMGAATSERLAPSQAVPRSPEFEQALQRLDELLRHLPASSDSPQGFLDTLVKRMSPHRSALVASASAPVERQVIELLSRLFDALLGDLDLPATVRSVVARLQASALRVALRDSTMVDSSNHAVWRLLDAICEAGNAYPQPTDPRAQALAVFCESLAADIAQASVPDAVLYTRALAQLDNFQTEQWQAQRRDARASIESLQRSERRELLETVLTQRLLEQMGPMRTTAGVRRFVSTSWSRVLAESMMRFGEDSETTRGYIKLVDELLWSVQLPDHPKSRQRLISLLPSLLLRLRAGMALIALPASEQDSVLAELMAIHTEALRPGRGEASAYTPEQLVQRMRDEVLPASTGHGAFRDSVIDLPSMQTVPAELMPGPSLQTEDANLRLDALRDAARVRLFLHGRWSKVQLLWCSERRTFYLFAGETAGRTHSITHRALERLNGVGLLQPLERKTAVQRALDKVTRDLLPNP